MGEHGLLAQKVEEIPIGLNRRGPAALLEAGLEEAGRPDQQRRRCQRQQDVHELKKGGGDRGRDHCWLAATIRRRAISAANISER